MDTPKKWFWQKSKKADKTQSAIEWLTDKILEDNKEELGKVVSDVLINGSGCIHAEMDENHEIKFKVVDLRGEG